MSKSEIKDEHALPVAEALAALRPDSLEEYDVTVYATTRMHCDFHVFAADIGHAAQIVKATPVADIADEYGAPWELSEGGVNIEGDEMAALTHMRIDDASKPAVYEEEQVDLRTEGEPFSWEACELVKDMAKFAVADGGIVEHVKEVQEFFARAIQACEVPKL